MAHFFMGCIVFVWSAVGMLGGLFFLAATLMALGNKKNRMDWKIDIIIAIILFSLYVLAQGVVY